jgi:hypothetical protein
VDRNGQAIEFVSPGCEGSGMAKEKNDEINAHILQARWFGERLERMNEALVTLSGTFIGFLGIELAFLGQLGPKEINTNWTSTITSRVSVISIILAIVLFVVAMKSDDFDMPDLDLLRKSWHDTKDGKNYEPLRILLDQDDNQNIIRSFEKENETINKWYPKAIYLGLLGQISLAVFLFAKWA